MERRPTFDAGKRIIFRTFFPVSGTKGGRRKKVEVVDKVSLLFGFPIDFELSSFITDGYIIDLVCVVWNVGRDGS